MVFDAVIPLLEIYPKKKKKKKKKDSVLSLQGVQVLSLVRN